MYINLTETGFKDQFRIMNRLDNFSPEALSALYAYYEELEEATGPIEMDVIAICCEWSEYDLDAIATEFGYLDDDEDEDAVLIAVKDNATVIEVGSGTYLVQQS